MVDLGRPDALMEYQTAYRRRPHTATDGCYLHGQQPFSQRGAGYLSDCYGHHFALGNTPYRAVALANVRVDAENAINLNKLNLISRALNIPLRHGFRNAKGKQPVRVDTGGWAPIDALVRPITSGPE